MKKLILLFIFIFSLSCIVFTRTVSVEAAELGTTSPDVNYYSKYQATQFGFLRTGDTSIEVTQIGGWGRRAGFKEQINPTNYEISINAAGIPLNTGLIMSFSNSEQGFASESSCAFSMDIVRHSVNENTYLVTLTDKPSVHNKSVEGFTNNVAWTGDSSYSGIVVESTTGDINIALKETNDGTTVTVNEFTVTVTSVMGKVTNQKCWLSIGLFNTNANSTYQINYAYDSESKEYFNNIYLAEKELLNQYSQMMEGDLTDIDTVVEISKVANQINLERLTEYDQAYLKSTKEDLDKRLKTAFDELQIDDLMPVAITKKVEYRTDAPSDLAIEIDLKNQALLNVTVDNQALTENDFTYNTTLVIKKTFLETLTIGEKIIKIETKYGIANISLNVSDGSEYDPIISEEKLTYQLGSNLNLRFDVDLNGGELSQILINEDVVNDYNIEDITVSIPAKILEKYPFGNYTLTIVTSIGEKTINLELLEDDGNVVLHPDKGLYTDDAFYYSRWQPNNHGAVRNGDLSMEICGVGSWGQRGGLSYAYDISDFEVSFNLAAFPQNGVLCLMFSHDSQVYASEPAINLIMDIAKDKNDPHKYMVTLSNTVGVHNVSLEGFSNNIKFSDSAFKGVTIIASDDNVTISLKKSGTAGIVTVNGEQYTINGVYDKVQNISQTYLGLGAFNISEVATYQLNYAYDAAMRTYYGENGKFGIVKKQFAEVEILVENLAQAEQIKKAEEAFEKIDLSVLTVYDQAYFNKKYEKIAEIIDEAIKNNPGYLYLTVNEIIKVYQDRVNQFKVLDYLPYVVDVEEDVFSYYDALKKADTQEARILISQINELKHQFDTKVQNILILQIDAYYTAATTATTIADIQNAFALRRAIRIEYSYYFEDFTEYEAKIDEAAKQLSINNSTISDNFEIGEEAYVVKNGTQFNVIQRGNDNAIICDQVQFEALNFELSMMITKLPSRFTIGIMEKPTTYMPVENDQVQTNKGIVFVFEQMGQKSYRVTLSIINMLSTQFSKTLYIDDFAASYDDEITISIIDVDGQIKISVGNYQSVTPIKTEELFIALGTKARGYLYFASENDAEQETIFTLSRINGETFDSKTIGYQDSPINDNKPTKPSKKGCSAGSLISCFVSLAAVLILIKNKKR